MISINLINHATLTGWCHIMNWLKNMHHSFRATPTDRRFFGLCLGKYYRAHSIDAALHGSLCLGRRKTLLAIFFNLFIPNSGFIYKQNSGFIPNWEFLSLPSGYGDDYNISVPSSIAMMAWWSSFQTGDSPCFKEYDGDDDHIFFVMIIVGGW